MTSITNFHQTLNQQEDDLNYNKKKSNHITIDVNKPYQNREIDTRWVELKVNGHFVSRSYFASCIQAGKVFIHGGYNQQTGTLDSMYEGQFYSLPAEWSLLKIKSNKQKNPPALRNHTLCAYKSYLILFGGQKTMLENNQKIFRFDLRTLEWEPMKIKNSLSSKIDIGLDSHVICIYNDSLYVFGGYSAQLGLYSNTLLKINLESISSGQIELIQIKFNSLVSPLPRGNSSATLCADNFYVFGGTNSNETFDDFWVFSFSNGNWTEIYKEDENKWPEKRKGQTMNYHSKSNSIFMFGGIKEITKEKNDMMVYLIDKQKWIKIHKNTNLLYDPSPTFKKQIENSPSIIQAKNKKLSKSTSKKKDDECFRITLKTSDKKNRTVTEGFSKQKQLTRNTLYRNMKTEYANFGNNFQSSTKKRISLVQQKKYKEFFNRKKKLLDQIQKNNKNLTVSKRPHSPTSQTLIYSIDTIGDQKKQTSFYEDDLPKVIFDEEKGAVIGKKPCARDGHSALIHEESIIILGGDRHRISFKDVFIFKMNKAIQNIHLYE